MQSSETQTDLSYKDLNEKEKTLEVKTSELEI